MFDPRIPCTYKGEKRWFHTWIQDGDMQCGTYLGAVLETGDGNIIKVYDITEIKFERGDV